MARKPRIHYPGAVYHVIARGNNKENVFKEKSDFQRYIDLIKRYKKKFGFLLYAYVLMDNHIHMLIEVKEEPLSRIMQGLQLSYTQYFNKKYNHVGHVFQQRYKGELCDKDQYLLTLIKYIHQNPIKAGIIEEYDYLWSSHKDYINNKGGLVDIEFPLNFFSQDRRKALKSYLVFLEAEDVEVPKHNPLINENSKGEKNQLEIESQEKKESLSLENVLELISNKGELNPQDIRKSSRKREIVRMKRLAMYVALELNIATRKQLADFLSISESNVTRGLDQFAQCEEELRVGKDLLKEITQ